MENKVTSLKGRVTALPWRLASLEHPRNLRFKQKGKFQHHEEGSSLRIPTCFLPHVLTRVGGHGHLEGTSWGRLAVSPPVVLGGRVLPPADELPVLPLPGASPGSRILCPPTRSQSAGHTGRRRIPRCPCPSTSRTSSRNSEACSWSPNPRKCVCVSQGRRKRPFLAPLLHPHHGQCG